MNKVFDSTNRGVLFHNDRKTQDKQPDWTGNINVGGTDYSLSAWVKEGKKGDFLSLAVSPKREKAPTRRPIPAAKPAPKADDGLDDEILF